MLSYVPHPVLVYCFHVGPCGHRGAGVSVSQVSRVSQDPREKMALWGPKETRDPKDQMALQDL